jgi:hypothetical protein
VTDGKKMEGSCLTGQSPQQAVGPVEEEEEFIYVFLVIIFWHNITLINLLAYGWS